MPSYTKLFSSIVTSTIWTEDDRTRIVWVTMLALADKHGEVHASVPGLARVAGVPVEDCEKAIARFLAPDKWSRTKDDEGRRIEEIDGGWALINHEKYRRMASKEDEEESNRERQRRYRERHARNGRVTESNGTVTVNGDIAEADAPINSPSQLRAPAKADVERMVGSTTYALSAECAEAYWNERESVGWTKKGQPITNWRADLARFASHWNANEQKQHEHSSRNRGGR